MEGREDKNDSWKWNGSRKGNDLKGRKDRKIKTGKGRDSQKVMIPKVLKDYKGKEREERKKGMQRRTGKRQGNEREASMYTKGQDYESGDSLVWSRVQGFWLFFILRNNNPSLTP